jgi:hypothetical protein
MRDKKCRVGWSILGSRERLQMNKRNPALQGYVFRDSFFRFPNNNSIPSGQRSNLSLSMTIFRG